MITKIVLKNFKVFQDSTIELNPGLNVLVGNNEAGKSTLLEAIHLGLTGRIGRDHISVALTPHHVNRVAAQEYVNALQEGRAARPPSILIELYMRQTEETVSLRGINNSLREDCPGLRLSVGFDDDYQTEYQEFVRDASGITGVPIEYYKAEWTAFSGTAITARSLKVGVSLIDASKIRLKTGSDYYLQKIIEESLTDVQRVRLARAYTSLKETFAQSEDIGTLNTSLNARQSDITDKTLSLSIDISPKAAWDASLVPHLDDLPFHHAGGGEQSTLKILLALARRAEGPNIVLIEEPENHLSFPLLNRLVKRIGDECRHQQVIVTTHSSYVLNKLGLNQLLLLKNCAAIQMSDLPEDTQLYFKKLAGYDTLRMVLADSVILVEGPSDDLIVQRAYLDKHRCLPIQNGVDVISIQGLSFERFLDIAMKLGTKTNVVTDNDGSPDAVAEKYKEYVKKGNIRICFSRDATVPTLEPQLVECNDLNALNKALRTDFANKASVTEHIQKKANKTDAALSIFDAEIKLTMPKYIDDAISD